MEISFTNANACLLLDAQLFIIGENNFAHLGYSFQSNITSKIKLPTYYVHVYRY